MHTYIQENKHKCSKTKDQNSINHVVNTKQNKQCKKMHHKVYPKSNPNHKKHHISYSYPCPYHVYVQYNPKMP